MIDLEKAKLLGRRVVIAPQWDWENLGSFVIPSHILERFPTAGFVLNKGIDCREDLKLGDYVIIPNEGMKVSHTYYSVLRVDLLDFGHILCEEEIEPILAEAVKAYRRNKTENNKITIQDIEGDAYQFLCSDVVDWGLMDMTTPAFNLDYVPTYILWHRQPDDDRCKPYYFVDEKEILAIVEF